MRSNENSEGLFQDVGEVKDVLISNIKEALDELDNQSRISIEMIRSFVNDALTEVFIDNFEEVDADVGLSVDEMWEFGLSLSNNVSYSRGSRELLAGEELPF